jgi:hypothetical protein
MATLQFGAAWPSKEVVQALGVRVGELGVEEWRLRELLRRTGDIDLAEDALRMEPRPVWVRQIVGHPAEAA